MSASKRPPFFVVGAQRSGTTMLRLMLNRHSRLNVPFESLFITEMFHKLPGFGDLSRHDNMRMLLGAICAHPFVIKGRLVPDPAAVLAGKPKDYPELVDRIFSLLAAARGKHRWGDKTPSYVEEMETLWRLFPGCKFIHLVRDGRDVATSLRGLSWGSKDLVKLARDWSWKVTLGRKLGEMVPGHYLEVRYEDLVCEPVPTLVRICHFIGEEFEDALLQYPATAQSEMPVESLNWHRNSTRAPDPAKVNSWRTNMSKTDQVVFDQIAGEALGLLGYDRSVMNPTFRSRLQFARYAILGHA